MTLVDTSSRSIIPENEAARMVAVRRYDILDTPPDGAFDRLTAIASRLFNVPIAIISVVDHDRIWFKSHDGCNGMSASADYLQPRPPVRGRFFPSGALVPLAGERYPLAALLALEQPYEMRVTVSLMRMLLDCPRRHECSTTPERWFASMW